MCVYIPFIKSLSLLARSKNFNSNIDCLSSGNNPKTSLINIIEFYLKIVYCPDTVLKALTSCLILMFSCQFDDINFEPWYIFIYRYIYLERVLKHVVSSIILILNDVGFETASEISKFNNLFLGYSASTKIFIKIKEKITLTYLWILFNYLGNFLSSY